MTRRLAALTLAATLSFTAVPASAHAAPPGVTACEQVARQVANASGAKPGSAAWNRVYDDALLRCLYGRWLPYTQVPVTVRPLLKGTKVVTIFGIPVVIG